MVGEARRLATLTALAGVMLATSGPAAAPASTTATSAFERSVIVEVNKVRRHHGLAPVKLNSRLSRAAEDHSRAMLRHGFFAHASRDGSAFWKRIERFYPSKPYRYWAVGETLLWSSGELGASRAVRMWMNSPPHRKVLLTPRWREVGVAAVRASAAPGTFGGRDVTVLTADFGIRR
jgi:uncharacterized protein YkwD